MRTIKDSVRDLERGQYFQCVLDATSDCIKIMDLYGRLEYVNAMGVELFGFDDIEAELGKSWLDFCDDNNRPVIAAAIAAAAAGERRTFRAFYPTAKGDPRWWETIVAPVAAVDGGAPVRLLARSRDVTAQIRTQTFLDTIIENVPVQLFVKDAVDGRFVLLNRAAEMMFGRRREEVLGRTDHDFFSHEQAEAFRLADREVIERGDVMLIEREDVADEGGQVKSFRTKKVCVRDADDVGHILVVTEDITADLAAAEELRSAVARAEVANQAKSNFLTNMSHEIRTPLNGLLGMAQAMLADDLSDVQRERLGVMQRSGEALLGVLNDILDIAKIEAGALELEDADFSLEALVDSALAAFAPLAARKQISLAGATTAAGRQVFRGDAMRIRQMIFNLLSNAVKFTERGGVEVLAAYADGALSLRFIDTGPGIPEAQIPHLFQKFVQADSSRTRRQGGAGLGLSISRDLAHLMGGSITVESRLGEGSTFTVAVPTILVADAGPEALDEEVLEQHAPRELNVLIAEDNPVNQLVLSTLLRQAGIEPVLVADGAQAVQAWRDGQWDIVLMDIQMPVMDGVEATRTIRSLEAAQGQPRTPIIAVTANTMVHQLPEYYAAGMDEVVSKPVRAEVLFAAIERAVAMHDTQGSRTGPD